TEQPASASRVDRSSPATPSPMTTTSTSCLPLISSASPASLPEAVDGVRLAQHRLCDVTNVDAARRHALLAAVVRVAVHDEIGTYGVDRFGEQVAAEEREDLRPLALHGLLHGGVVQERDAPVGAEAVERGGEPVGQGDRMVDERLHLRLAERG